MTREISKDVPTIFKANAQPKKAFPQEVQLMFEKEETNFSRSPIGSRWLYGFQISTKGQRRISCNVKKDEYSRKNSFVFEFQNRENWKRYANFLA